MTRLVGNGWRGDHRLPRAAFVDDDLYAAEQQRIFRRSWQLVAHASELSAPGSYVRRRLFTDDVIVIRERQGHVNVLLNSCQHRGTQLCRSTAGEARSFRCSYHGWTYDSSGRLIGVPGQKTGYGPDFDKADYALPEAQVAEFRGLIFAAWEPERSLADALGDTAWYLETLLGVTTGGWHAYAPPVHYRRQGNWKLDAENFAGDGYHLTTTHRSMYDTGVMGRDAESERQVVGHCVAFPQGNALRTVHLRLPDGPAFLGFPEARYDEIAANLGPDRAVLLDGNTVFHGNVFPNTSFIKVSLGSVGDVEEEPWTCYVMFRTSLPDGPRHSILYQWVLVPDDYPGSWADRSYKFAMRSHGPAQVFEVDDVENFARIQTALQGARGREGVFDYRLGEGVDAEDGDGWPGPGDVDPRNVSEHGQRAFYSRWLELMSQDTERAPEVAR